MKIQMIGVVVLWYYFYMEEKSYTKEEVKKIVEEEVDKAIKEKGYNFNKWAVQYFIGGVVGIIVIIIFVVVVAALGF